MNKVTYFLLLFALIFNGFGCAVNNNISSETPETMTVSADTRIINHAMGKTTIKGTPQRIVILTNEATDIVLALGVKPVGAVKSWQGEPYYDYIAKKMEGVPPLGDEFQPNLEQIVALKPDLIIGSKVRQQGIYSRLSAIAPTVFSETIGVSWKDNLRLYAQALNRETEGENLLREWAQKVKDFREKLGQQPPTVSLVRFLAGKPRIYYDQSFPGQIVKELGLLRPLHQQKSGFADEVGLESIFLLDADFLFYFTHDKGDNRGKIKEQEWLNHPLWQTLEVVKQGRVYGVNDVHWTTSGGILAAHQVLADLSQYILATEK